MIKIPFVANGKTLRSLMTMSKKARGATALVLAATVGWPQGAAAQRPSAPPLTIQEQGSFAVGGTVIRNPGTFDSVKQSPDGQTLHGDHARVFFQVPVNARKLPLVFWHGFGQFSKTWETTPDGREGFQNLFLRRRFAVIPIVVYYGDNIPTEPSANPGQDNWRVRLAMVKLWADAVNRRGGNVTVVHLPAIGIRGNTHFPFSDLNNLQIADLMSEFLKRKGLD